MRKRFAAVALMFTLLLVQNASADLTKIADNVYAYVGSTDASPRHSFAANAGIVIGRDGVLVVDTLISAKEGERFLADIRKVTEKPIRYVVNTHTHLDHALGNCVFTKAGATVISQEEDRKSLAANGAEILKHADKYGLTAEDLAGTEIAVPSLSFSDDMVIDLGGEEVRLSHPAASHTPGSLVVYLPKEKLLFSGDILFTDFHPYLADSDLAGWGRSIDHLLAMDIERIVPGHGPLSTKKDLREMKAYLARFDATAREMVEDGASVEAIADELKSQLPRRSMGGWMVEYNLKNRYMGKEVR